VARPGDGPPSGYNAAGTRRRLHLDAGRPPGAGQRWHWVGYPYKLGLGVDPEHAGERYTAGTTELVATEFTGESPGWDRTETYTLPLVFPGLRTWDDLVDESHPRVEDVRNRAVTMWELSENAPESFIRQWSLPPATSVSRRGGSRNEIANTPVNGVYESENYGLGTLGWVLFRSPPSSRI
jgi:hypothetical protein